MLCNKRLRKELQALDKERDPYISLVNDPESLLSWTAHITGPHQSVYEGYRFKLSILVSTDYPHVPPVISFVTRIFHPNVSTSGEICLDILKKEWSPAWTLQAACRAIMMLLENPEPDSPLNCDAGNVIRAGDMRAYRSMARFYCEEYAEKI